MDDSSELPLAETVVEEDDTIASQQRDRIVILGRRASGKTVFLSVLYEKYWRSLDGLTMKAVSGNVHSELVRVADGLRQGRWPPATLETQHCDLEIHYRGSKHLLVALDYAGEIFRRAFVEDATDAPEAKALVRHIDSAAAVILLIDPVIAVSGNVDATIDDDFGMTQAVSRIRNWPGGQEVPFVIAFTKCDVNRALIHAEGGPTQFVTRRFPALARTLQKVQIFQVSAVQVQKGPTGMLPRSGSDPWQIEKPLLYCLDHIESRRRHQQEQELLQQRLRVREAARFLEEKAQRRSSRLVTLLGVLIIVVVVCVGVLIWLYRT